MAGANNWKLVPDAELTDAMARQYDLMLVGAPEANSVSKKLKDKGFTTLSFAYPGKDYGLLELSKDVFAPGKDVLLAAGSNSAGSMRAVKQLLAVHASK